MGSVLIDAICFFTGGFMGVAICSKFDAWQRYRNIVTEIDRVHDTLIDLLCSAMKFIPYEKPEIGDWCYEMTSGRGQNRDCKIGVLKEILGEDEFVTVTVGGKEIHWKNAVIKKIPSDLLREGEEHGETNNT